MGAPSCMRCRGAAVSPDQANRCVWVGSNGDLARAARQWGDIVGLDTEFQRTDTFYAIPGLYQVAADSGMWLIDPLAIDDWAPLVRVLDDPHIVKVLHACSEDLELFYHHLGVQPENLFDTQVAYAFVSETFSCGYANLVERLLGTVLPKHQTRSNWLRRPLSEAQHRYAQEDIAYLLPLHESLSARLEACGRLGWFKEEMRRRARYAPRLPEAYYQGVKKAWRLDGAQLAVLKHLCAWRERRAMHEDVPRNRVVWDDHLVELAQRDDVNMSDMRRMLPPSVARRYAGALIEAHRAGLEAVPEAPLPRPLSQRQGGMLKRLRKIGSDRAAALGVAPELVTRQRDLEECIRRFRATGQYSETFQGWRRALLGDEFAAVLGERG